MKNGLYLCKVKGLKYLDYALLRYNEDGWWQYIHEYTGDKLEGWCANSLEIVEVMDFLMAEEEQI